MERLEVLRERVNALLRQYAKAVQEQAALKRALERTEAENTALRAQLAQAEERLLALQIGRAMPDDETRAQGRRQLDAVIGEIDKILTALHD